MNNHTLLEKDFEQLENLITIRLNELCEAPEAELSCKFELPDADSQEGYEQLLVKTQLNTYERITLLLSLSSYLKAEILDPLYLKNNFTNTTFTQIGGRISQNTSAFLPTGETAMFLCSGNSISERIQLQNIFDNDNKLYKHNLLHLHPTPLDEPPLTGRIVPTDECLHTIFYKTEFKPNFSGRFPAKLLETKLTWEDLVLDYDTEESLDELFAWLSHHSHLEQMNNLSKKFKRGYRALFHGPPGTGKTLTATLMGNKHGMKVYHIDLSMLVSKYVGETEKNLKHIFDTAENKNWILFFDEADSIFGKRTQTNSSNDRYANQEVSYLLQRVEDYPGMIILASNLKANMDKAFLRRFQSVIYFPMPGVEERYTLWRKAFADDLTLEKSIKLRDLAKNYEISGASIGNVLRYCSLMTLKREENIVYEQDIITGIKRELAKEGKIS